MAKPKVAIEREVGGRPPSIKSTFNRDREVSLAAAAIEKSIETKERLFRECLDEIINVAHVMANALGTGGKVVFFGNGGSAADAQHISAELVGKFKTIRPALKALALTTNSSIITAIGNDFSFDDIFVRQVQANLERGDVAIGISTSGRSRNVINGIQEARRIGATTIALTGSGGGELASLCDHKVVVPSNDTQRIQECHIMIGHIICELIDDAVEESTTQT